MSHKHFNIEIRIYIAYGLETIREIKKNNKDGIYNLTRTEKLSKE